MSPHTPPHTGLYTPAPANSLPVGTRMHEYEIKAVIGEGGFGIVYLATDLNLGREVAIKEYLPISHAMRLDQYQVQARTPEQQMLFDKGLQSFVAEARILAQFRNPNLVEVMRFWEGNGTAYIVMPYYKGKTLRELVQKGFRATDRASLFNLLLPLLNGLEQVHGAGCYHRDISPDNIVVLPDGSPLLLDFGAARHEIISQADSSTVILKPGFAPIEQYGGRETASQQGPWSDIYALSAVAYQLITGGMPPSSVARIMRDPLQPLAQQASGLGLPWAVLKAIDEGLQVQPQDRPQSIAQFRELLLTPEPSPAAVADDRRMHQQPIAAAMATPMAAQAGLAPAAAPVAHQGQEARQAAKTYPWLALLAIACLLGVAGFLFWLFAWDRNTAIGDGLTKPPEWLEPVAAVQPPPTQIVAPLIAASAHTEGLDVPGGENPAAPHGALSEGQGAGGVEIGTSLLPDEVLLVDAEGHAVVVAEGEREVQPIPLTDTAASADTDAEGQALPLPEPEAPAPVPTTGTIIVQAQPWGDVYLNGELVGTTPPSVRLEVPPGSATVEVRNDSAPAHVQSFNIEVGKTVRVNHHFTQ